MDRIPNIINACLSCQNFLVQHLTTRLHGARLPVITRMDIKWWMWCSIFCTLFLDLVFCDDYRARLHQAKSYGAIINITYKDPITGVQRSDKGDIGKYGQYSRMDPQWGLTVHVRSEDGKHTGCLPLINVPSERWIALVQRGGCKFEQKIYNAAVKHNASAVVIYNHQDEDSLIAMRHAVQDAVAVFINHKDGVRFTRLVDNGTRVTMHIVKGSEYPSPMTGINRTSVLFVSISFIVLMIISLAWLVFYYIQRFRYAHAKERLSKRLMNAAKKAITKMPVKTVKNGDQETDSDFDQCAVCIEPYKASDVIRILPCKHLFHKSCVDPWLIEQRSCPMCKLDILKAYGMQIQGSRESMVNVDLEGPSTSFAPSEMGHGLHHHLDDGIHEIETVHFQDAQVDCHNTALVVEHHHHHCCGTVAEEDEDCNKANADSKPILEEKHSGKRKSSKAGVKSAASMESIRSSDESDSNELQSLMPNQEDALGKASSDA